MQWSDLKIPLFVMACGCCAPASTEGPGPREPVAEIDHLVESLHAAGELDGAILVSRGGEVIYRRALGIADCSSGEENAIDTVFSTASITKPFTALAIMMLADEGQLDLRSPVRQLLPAFPYPEVTVEHLLTHTSGIPNYAHDPRFQAYLDGLEKGTAVAADVVRWLERESPALEFVPGERRRYSNTGYVVLARILEVESGLDYGEFLEHRIFGPVGMERTFVWTRSDAATDRWSRGHERSLDRRTRQPFVSRHGRDLDRILGDSGIHSTVDDLFKLDQALYTDELVSSELLERAFEPFRLRDGSLGKCGYGWFIRSEPGGPRLVWHGGIGGGYLTSFHRELDERNTVIILSNGTSHHLTIDGLANAILDVLNDRAPGPPRVPISHPVAATLFAEGPDAATALYRTLLDSASDGYLSGESELNLLGYRLMWAGHLEKARAILELNAEEFPSSANVYDSLGDLYLAEARAAYQRALEIDPSFAVAERKLTSLSGHRSPQAPPGH
jgi:CubicO group peptidase (beta-lactamase class C family)